MKTTQTLKIGDATRLILNEPNNFFDCVMTSPPYWGLRDYGHNDQIGLEATPELYLEGMLNLFDNIKLKLKDEGNCFVNLGDTFSTKSGGIAQGKWNKLGHDEKRGVIKQPKIDLPDKCLCMIPQRFAWGMIDPNWKLRDDLSKDDKTYVISELIKRKII